MINALKNRFSPSVDSITSALSGSVTQLEKLAARKLASAGALREEAERTHSVADAEEQEASRATRTAQRIAKLLA